MCPPTCRTRHTHNPRAIPIIGQVWGQVQLSHSHAEQPRGDQAALTPPGGQSQSLPHVEEAGVVWPTQAQGVPTSHAPRGSGQLDKAHLRALWDRLYRMATSRVVATAGAGVAAMPLLTCGITEVEGNS